MKNGKCLQKIIKLYSLVSSLSIWYVMLYLIREVKNKETGIDLSVNSYNETKSMLGSNFEYQVMVVTHLSIFKSAKHSDGSTIQYTVSFNCWRK